MESNCLIAFVIRLWFIDEFDLSSWPLKCAVWVHTNHGLEMNKHRQSCLFLWEIPNCSVKTNELYSVLVTVQQLKPVWYVLRLLSCPHWGLLRETAHLSDLLHLEIDFYMWPWTFEISFSKPCQSRRGKKTRKNQFKLISEMRCFCLLL